MQSRDLPELPGDSSLVGATAGVAKPGACLSSRLLAGLLELAGVTLGVHECSQG
jgi:hypothetical protein